MKDDAAHIFHRSRHPEPRLDRSVNLMSTARSQFCGVQTLGVELERQMLPGLSKDKAVPVSHQNAALKAASRTVLTPRRELSSQTKGSISLQGANMSSLRSPRSSYPWHTAGHLGAGRAVTPSRRPPAGA